MRVVHTDDRHVLIPHMLKCRNRYMASLILYDLLGLDTSRKCLQREQRGSSVRVDSVYQLTVQTHDKCRLFPHTVKLPARHLFML